MGLKIKTLATVRTEFALGSVFPTLGFYCLEVLTESDHLGVTTFLESMGLLGASMAICQAATEGGCPPAHSKWAVRYVGEIMFTIRSLMLKHRGDPIAVSGPMTGGWASIPT